MKLSSPDQDQLASHLKHLVAGMFLPELTDPDTLSDDEPLLHDGLGLDSCDLLELVMCIEEEFGVTIRTPEEAHRAFASIASLAGFIQARINTPSVRPHNRTVARNSFRVLRSPSPSPG